MGTRFERPISITERMWLCVDHMTPPYANQIVLEGRGDLDFNALKDAVDKASAANPGTRVVLEGSLRKMHWVDSGVCPRVRKVDGNGWSGFDGQNAPFLEERLPYTGPTCEVLYVTGDPAHIIFRSTHAVMDASGTLTWALDVFRILRGEQPVGSNSTLTEEVLVREFATGTKKMHPIDNIAPTGKSEFGVSGITWKRITIPHIPSKVLGKVGLALAKSAWKHGSGAFRLAIPVDLRQRKPGLLCTGNLTMAIYSEVTPDSTPDTIAADIHRQIENKQDCVLVEGGNYMDLVPLWLMELGMRAIFAWNHLTGRFGFSAMLSYIPRVDTRFFSGGGFTTGTMFGIPPRIAGFPVFLGMGGFKNHMEFIISMPNALASGGRMDRLVEEIQQALA